MSPPSVLVGQGWRMFNDPKVDFDENKCLYLLDKVIDEKVKTLWDNRDYKVAFPAGINKNNIVGTLQCYKDDDREKLFENVKDAAQQASFKYLVYEITVLSRLRDYVNIMQLEGAIFVDQELCALSRMNIKPKVLAKKLNEASNKTSGFAILETWVIEEVQPDTDNDDMDDDNDMEHEDDMDDEDAHGYEEMNEPPHFPFILEDYVPDSVPSTHSDSSLKPHGHVKLVNWPNFRQSFNKFLSSSNQDNARLHKLYPFPAKRDAVYVVKEVDVSFVLRYAISDTILRFYKNDRIKLLAEHTLIFGRPNFCLVKDGLVYIAMQCNHPKTHWPRTREELINIFMQQSDDNKTLETARPVNQIVNYLVENSVKRGILTCLEGSVALEMEVNNEEKVIKVTDMVPSNEILKLLAFLLHRAMNDTEAGNSPRLQNPKSSNQIDENVSPDQRESSLNFRDGGAHIPGKYTESADTFKAIDHETLYCHFKDWKLDIPTDKTIIGRGRTGLVCLATVYHVDTPDTRYDVAVKCGDFMKVHCLKKELQNEARVIKYANNLGLKCVPQLHYSGYFGYGGVMYMNCTRYIDGYTKDLSQLNIREQDLLKSALAELRMANIVHNDLKNSNILFTTSQCYILDFGASKIMERDILHDKLEFVV